MTDFQAWAVGIQHRTEANLSALLPASSIAPQRLHEAMRYAALEGGKTFTTTGLTTTEIAVKPEAWTLAEIDFSAVSGADDNPNFVVRLTMAGGGGQQVLPERVTMGLLPYINAHALDEDYAQGDGAR